MVSGAKRPKNFLRFIFLLSFTILSTAVFSQTSIRADYESTDPVPKDSSLEFEEKLEIHLGFLVKAKAEKNLQHEFFGQLYVFYDHLKLNDFVTAAKYLLAGKKIAEEAQNDAWLGWMNYWQGVLKTYLKNQEEALVHYQDAVRYCATAGDSLCYGESLEQVASNLMYFDSFALAEQYFLEAMPLLEKFGEQKHLATAYGNFGGFYLLAREPEKGIPWLERALLINQETENYKGEAKNRNNLASAYRRQGNAKRAIEEYKKCIAFNEEHGMPNNLINNYLGLYFAHLDLNDYKSALESVSRHEELKDSLIGLETQQKIALLESQFEMTKTELALERTEAKLIKAELSKTRAIIGVVVAVFLIGFIIWRWQAQQAQARKEVQLNKENLIEITKVLADKSRDVARLKSALTRLESENKDLAKATDDQEVNLYINTILTDEDWNSFRTSFEKLYPGYLFRLRSVFSDLTPAEERLFLLLKLNLGRREIADMLGLSVGSIKKTRTRLRKRLSLELDDSLEDFIKNF
ncbi:tetratricopeptide repeat protein [Lewinella sp. LCG006]|uniref:tetratricopeptide repeat protein n=1 Tax=Lewinella sp. LCG006 TaxID=3231911 RepID=UPI00345FFACA